MVGSVSEGERLRAAFADLYSSTRTIEQSKRHLWLTDCESLFSYLTNPIAAGTEDKRLEIDLEDLRQTLWEDPSGRPKDDITEDQIDKIRWIDTSTMLADPLTKLMKSDRLRDALVSSTVDLTPTTQSQIAKWMKQKQRRKLDGPELHLDPLTGCVVDPQYSTVDLTSVADDRVITAVPWEYHYMDGKYPLDDEFAEREQDKIDAWNDMPKSNRRKGGYPKSSKG